MEDEKYYYGTLNPGEAEGVECSYCGFLFIVFGTDDIKKHPIQPIPLSGNVDYYCPCCGKNLKDKIKQSLNAS